MDIDVLREQLEREIAAADEAIRGRETQIAALKQENEVAVARIEHAREALAVLDQLIAKLEVLGPLATEAALGDQAGKRVPQKKIVDPIVAAAERSGITVEEMIASVIGVSPSSVLAELPLSIPKPSSLPPYGDDGPCAGFRIPAH